MHTEIGKKKSGFYQQAHIFSLDRRICQGNGFTRALAISQTGQKMGAAAAALGGSQVALLSVSVTGP